MTKPTMTDVGNAYNDGFIEGRKMEKFVGRRYMWGPVLEKILVEFEKFNDGDDSDFVEALDDARELLGDAK